MIIDATFELTEDASLPHKMARPEIIFSLLSPSALELSFLSNATIYLTKNRISLEGIWQGKVLGTAICAVAAAFDLSLSSLLFSCFDEKKGLY